MKCIDCKYSHGQPGGLECRGGTPIGDERFPLVRDDQWCGVFEMAELNVVSPVPLSTRDGTVPPEELTPPSGESAISRPKPPANRDTTEGRVPAAKKSHAKPPRRKGKHGQETSSQES